MDQMAPAEYTIHDIPLPDLEEEEIIARSVESDNVVLLPSAKKSTAHHQEQADDDEADPVDLFGKFPTPDVPWSLIPDVIREFAKTRSRQIGCDPAGLVMATITTCAAALRDNVKIKVQAHNDKWCESARFWTLVSGPPSSKKSPILKAASECLRVVDEEKFLDWRAEKQAYNATPKNERRGPPPPLRRLLIQDTTIEAAQGVLAGSPWGVCLVHDEFAGFFGAMEKYGGAGASHDRTVWLQSFNGGPYIINRKKNEDEGGIMIPNLSVSMLGGIQPDVVRRLVEQSSDDGMIQRFLPIVLKTATVGEDVPMPDVTTPFEHLTRTLHGMEEDMQVSFDTEAQDIFREAQLQHKRLEAIELVYKQLATHIGKYDGIYARLCLLWHCIEHAGAVDFPPTVNAETATRARDFLHGFLLKHAFAFYAGTLDRPDGHDRLRAIAGFILAKGKTVIKNRDVQSSVRTNRGLKDHDIRPLFEQLAALGWLDRIEGMRAGSPPHWRVNPRVHVLFAEKAQEEIIRREEVRAIIAETAVDRRKDQAQGEC